MNNKYVPQFILDSNIFKKIYQAQQYEIDKLNGNIEDIVRQCFITTATWSLELWEQEFEIPTDITDTFENRRARLKAKLRGQATVTKETIKNVAMSFANGEVEVIEDNVNNQFTIKFVGKKGIPPKIEDLKQAIENIKPAHLKALYVYTYNTWGMVSSLTWGAANSKTWEQLREGDI